MEKKKENTGPFTSDEFFVLINRIKSTKDFSDLRKLRNHLETLVQEAVDWQQVLANSLKYGSNTERDLNEKQ